jgi:tryptophan halogenase
VDRRTAEINRVNHVTIVGGGTAGWLVATVLNNSLNERGEGPPVRITLIESPNVPTVGVGEATVPGMPRLLGQLGIDEKQFFLRCNASFKLGVRFVGWDLDEAGRPLEYFHPFDAIDAIDGVDPSYHFHRFVGAEHSAEFFDRLSPSGEIIRAFKGPRRIEDQDYHYRVRHAYHLDAGLFAHLLRDFAVARGVEHILDDVVEVKQGETGYVTALRLKERGIAPVQLVVDCSGFSSLIMGKVLDEPFESMSDLLLCDSALAVQIPHPDPTRIEPCTRSTALGAGWCWRVPLFSRVGTGYVFSSRFRTDEEAVEEFRGYLGEAGKDVEPRLIRMRIGRRSRGWVKNCVAIGLSGGFVEPLESTAIYMIEMAARWLVRHFPDRSINPVLAKSYNRAVRGLFEEVRDFIALHYYSSNRPEPFWVAARSEIEPPDSLRESLELWRHTFPNEADTKDHNLFIYWNYLCVLYSKGYFKGASMPLEDSVSREGWDRFTQRLEATKHRLLRNLPDHYELLAAIRQGAEREARFHAPPSAVAAAAGAYRSTVPLPDWGQEAPAAVPATEGAQ